MHKTISYLVALLLLQLQPAASVDFNATAPNLAECAASFKAFNLDIFDLTRYDTYFRNTSTVVLAEAGEFVGPDAIAEYVSFATATSPYNEDQNELAIQVYPKRVDPNTGNCEFIIQILINFENNPDVVRETNILVQSMLKVQYDYHESYISNVDVFFTKAYLNFFFGTILNTDRTRNYICGVSEGCEDTNVGLSREECVQKLAELPILTDGQWLDGYDYGCRTLHAVFAEANPSHCPHLSFEPQEDDHGYLVCQESQGLDNLERFDENDFQGFEDFGSEWDIDPLLGYKILELPRDRQEGSGSIASRIKLGLVVPVVIFLLAMLANRFQRSSTSQDSEDDNAPALVANKGRRLCIIGSTFIDQWVGI
ncbi:MAG: hypothetical protein SGARI_001469 [Bacillariaceae sp.]